MSCDGGTIMSSISDALKKAQNSRVGDTPRSVSPPPRAVPPQSEPPSTSSPSRISLTVSVVAALAVGLVIVLVATQYIFPTPRSAPSRSDPPVAERGAAADETSRGVAVDPVASVPAKAVDQAPRSAPAVKPVPAKSDSSAPSPLEGEGRGEGAASVKPGARNKDMPAPSPLEAEGRPEGTVVVSAKAAQEPLPVLSGTFYSEQNPVAIINGFALKEGETVGGFRIVKILPRGVILKSGSGEVELRLK